MGSEVEVLVVIPCSKRKRESEQPSATSEELQSGRFGYEGRLRSAAVEARELYLGRQHRHMVREVDRLRDARRDLRVGLVIVSAGYGLLEEHDLAVPYEATLGGSRSAQVGRGLELGLPEAALRLAGRAEYVVVALGAAYLAACGLPSPELPNGICLAPASVAGRGDSGIVACGRNEARFFGKAEREIRGYVLGELLASVAGRGLIALAEAQRGDWWPGPRQQQLLALL